MEGDKSEKTQTLNPLLKFKCIQIQYLQRIFTGPAEVFPTEG